MPERQSRHGDNELIDRMSENPTPEQQSRSGGNVSRAVATRAELNRATDPDDRERAVGSDNPAQDAEKGPVSSAKLQKEQDAGNS